MLQATEIEGRSQLNEDCPRFSEKRAGLITARVTRRQRRIRAGKSDQGSTQLVTVADGKQRSAALEGGDRVRYLAASGTNDAKDLQREAFLFSDPGV